MRTTAAPREDTRAPALKLSALLLRYKRFTLGPIDLDLPRGRVIGLVGLNGSGKTTTLRCVAGNLQPDAGEIAVFGHRARHDDASWKQIIGYVPDKPEFFEDMCARDHLRFVASFYPSWSGELAAELVSRFRLELNSKMKHLSAGNRVKTCLVAALAHRPRLALFDEPTAGIDPVVRAEVFEVLGEMMEDQEMTVLYSTHIVDDLHRLADDLVFLRDGRVELYTSKDDLIDQWRRIRFELAAPAAHLADVVSLEARGAAHQVISRQGARTIETLTSLGAENIRAVPLTLEEIAVRIMRGETACPPGRTEALP